MYQKLKHMTDNFMIIKRKTIITLDIIRKRKLFHEKTYVTVYTHKNIDILKTFCKSLGYIK